MDEHVVIRPFEERPEVAAQLAEWFTAEWPEYHRGKTLGDVSSMFRFRDIQQTFVAEIDGVLVGTAAVRNSWNDAPDIATPWIGGLFVHPDHRGHGVGMALVDAACDHAFAAGHEAVHVAIRDRVESYRGRGWKVVGTMMTGDEAVTVLRRDAA